MSAGYSSTDTGERALVHAQAIARAANGLIGSAVFEAHEIAGVCYVLVAGKHAHITRARVVIRERHGAHTGELSARIFSDEFESNAGFDVFEDYRGVLDVGGIARALANTHAGNARTIERDLESHKVRERLARVLRSLGIVRYGAVSGGAIYIDGRKVYVETAVEQASSDDETLLPVVAIEGTITLDALRALLASGIAVSEREHFTGS